MHEYKVGDLVLLTFSTAGYGYIPMGLLKYKDRKFRILRVKQLKGQTLANRGTYYELKGCVSEHGVQYTISPDWIVPMRELKRK